MFTKTQTIDLSQLQIVSGGSASFKDGALVIERNPGEALVIRLPKETSGYAWVPEDYLVLDCQAQQYSRVDTSFKFRTGEDILSLQYNLIPLRRVKMAVLLDELASKRWFLQTRPGSLKGHVAGKPTHIDNIDYVDLVVAKGRQSTTFTIFNLYLSKELPDFTVTGQPMVDRFGQWKDMEWDGKIYDEAKLVAYLKDEYQRALTDNAFPEGFSKYGGCLQKRFEAKGVFYKHHDGKRWWLVDPDGYAFFSSGICYASRMGVHGFVDGMRDLFDFLPPMDDPTFKDAWTTADQIPEFVKRNGVEAGKGRYMFNFARANMIRAFGDNWWNAWVTINTARMKRWGFNTISVCVNNYFDERAEDYLNQAKIPFTWTLKCFPKTQSMIFRDFPDVFADEYKQLCKAFAQQLTAFRDNPFFIGYFINNEPEWLVQRNTNVAARLLETLNNCVSKTVFIDWLAERHTTIQDFNKAWNTSLESFQQLMTTVIDCNHPTETAQKDLADFRQRLIEEYVRIPTDELKAICPQALNLGMRYANVTEADFAGDTLFDMFSSNNYTRDPKGLLDLVSRCSTMPLIVGEWHYGGSDKGLLSNALVNATTQDERGKACANYLMKTMSNPQCVGVHYFEFNDQPVLGRFDGECMQHGLIDVCNQPHDDCIKRMAEVNKQMFAYCSGDLEPVYQDWEYNERF